MIWRRGFHTFSQFGQDLCVLGLLDAMRGGFFLDSGASNGVRVNNTLLLERSFGWRGICVEPNATFFSQLKNARVSHCVRCCLYSSDGEVDFLQDAQVLGGILGEYHPDHLREAVARYRLPLDARGKPFTVRAPARSIRSVLRECSAPPVIDYWSLDTEGSELALLESFPFDEYSFRVLTVEHNNFPVRERIRRFLADRGYARVRALGCDDCYAKDLGTRAGGYAG